MVDETDRTPLVYVCEMIAERLERGLSNLKILDFLLKQGSQMQHQSHGYHTALDVLVAGLVRTSLDQHMHLLLDTCFCILDTADANEKLASTIAAQDLLQWAARVGYGKTVLKLVDMGTDPDFKETNSVHGWNSLQTMIAYDPAASHVQHVITKSQNIYVQDKFGNGLIHLMFGIYAEQSKDATCICETLSRLLDAGLDINSLNFRQESPIMLAISHAPYTPWGSSIVSICKFMLEHGANVELEMFELKHSPFGRACSGTNLEVIRVLLEHVKHCAPYRKPQLADRLLSPLELAAYHASTIILEFLLDNPDLYEQYPDPQPHSRALHMAYEGGNRAAAEILVARGYNINARCEKTGYTLLQLAALHNKQVWLMWLLESRADPFAKTNGCDAKQLAEENDHHEIAYELEKCVEEQMCEQPPALPKSRHATFRKHDPAAETQ